MARATNENEDLDSNSPTWGDHDRPGGPRLDTPTWLYATNDPEALHLTPLHGATNDLKVQDLTPLHRATNDHVEALDLTPLHRATNDHVEAWILTP